MVTHGYKEMVARITGFRRVLITDGYRRLCGVTGYGRLHDFARGYRGYRSLHGVTEGYSRLQRVHGVTEGLQKKASQQMYNLYSPVLPTRMIDSRLLYFQLQYIVPLKKTNISSLYLICQLGC